MPSIKNKKYATCGNCSGRGKVKTGMRRYTCCNRNTCSQCRGRGWYFVDTWDRCGPCRGSGRVEY